MLSGPLTTAQVKAMTQWDPVLSRVHSYVLRGWPTTVDSSFNPFSSRKHELSVCNGCVLWGNYVIIPGLDVKQSWMSYMILTKGLLV